MIKFGTTFFLLGIFILFDNTWAIAQEADNNIPDNCNQIIKQDSSKVNVPNIANFPKDTNTSPAKKSISDITQASFCWAAEQFDPFNGSLIQNWLTHPHKHQINLIVNWQLWTLLDYFGRYRFVNQFGTVARKYGYSLNIFNQKKQWLASYKYNPLSIPPKWELNLNNL